MRSSDHFSPLIFPTEKRSAPFFQKKMFISDGLEVPCIEHAKGPDFKALEAGKQRGNGGGKLPAMSPVTS